MERIHGDGGGGELSIGDIAAQTRISSGSGSGGGGSSPREVLDLCVTSRNTPVGGGGGKKHRRLRKHFHQQQHYHKKGKQRIRRNTQSAPNNTNEFLMQEHDHLFHLDFDNEDWDHHHHRSVGPVAEGAEFSGGTGPQNAFYSSSDDDEDYLQREFSATYDNVNAERLSSMSKSELISEYQMLQERVETLERKLKTAEDSRPADPSVNLLALSEDDRLRLVQSEILKLRDENHKFKSANKYLRKLMYRGPLYVPPTEIEADNYMEADQISTDSGGGSGSVE